MKKIFIILVIAGMTYTVNAQGLGLGPVAGYQKAQDAENGSLLGGVALRMKLNKAIGVEGSILVRSEQYANETIKVTNYPIMVTGLFYPIPIAYGAVGVGWYNSRVQYQFGGLDLIEPNDETTQEFGWHFGGGVELPVGPNMSLTGDIRYVFLNYNFEKVPGSEDLKNDFFFIDVGLMFGL